MAKVSIDTARAQRAAQGLVLADLATGRLSPVEAVQRSPDALSGVDLWRVLLSVAGLGPESARQVCERAKVWPLTRMRDLTESDRSAIVLNLPKRVLPPE